MKQLTHIELHDELQVIKKNNFIMTDEGRIIIEGTTDTLLELLTKFDGMNSKEKRLSFGKRDEIVGILQRMGRK